MREVGECEVADLQGIARPGRPRLGCASLLMLVLLSSAPFAHATFVGTISYGNQRVGTTSAPQGRTFSVSGGTFVVSSVQLIGGQSADFAISKNTCASPVGPGGSCRIEATFSPTATGMRSTTLRVNSNAEGSPHDFTLTGVGIQPAVSLSPTSLNLGSQLVGFVNGPDNVTLTNSGGDQLVIGSITLGGSDLTDFEVISDNCSGQLLPSAGSCQIQVLFRPTATGARGANLSIPSDAPTTPDVVALSGTGVQPELAQSAQNLDFGTQLVGSTSDSLQLNLGNSGSAPLTFGVFAITGGQAAEFSLLADNCSGQTLAVAAQCTVQLRFSPAALGSRNASLQIASDAANNPHSAALTGTGVQPGLDLSPSPVNFGDQLRAATSATVSVTATNTGTAPLTIGSLSLSGPQAAEFAIVADTCGSAVMPGDSCGIDLSFTPAVTGARMASLVVTSDAPSSPDSVTLQGNGTVIAGVECPDLPQPGCTAAIRSSLAIRAGKQLRFKWKGGVAPSAVGTPDTDTHHVVCLWVDDELRLQAHAGPGAAWKADGGKAAYKLKGGNDDGVERIKVKAGDRGSVAVKLGAANLPILPLAPGDDVTVQLINDAGLCAQAQYEADLRKDDGSKVNAKEKRE